MQLFGSKCGDPCDCGATDVCSGFQSCLEIVDYNDAAFDATDCFKNERGDPPWNGIRLREGWINGCLVGLNHLPYTDPCCRCFSDDFKSIAGQRGVYVLLCPDFVLNHAVLEIRYQLPHLDNPLVFDYPVIWVGIKNIIRSNVDFTGRYTLVPAGCSPTPAFLTLGVCPP